MRLTTIHMHRCSARQAQAVALDVPAFGTNPAKAIFQMTSRYALSIVNAISSRSIQYGVSVSESSAEVRNAFIRKVYTILCECGSISSSRMY